jgi:hypothetical protein
MLLSTVTLLAALAARAAVPAEEPEPAPLAWGATDATYTLTIPAEGPLEVELKWRFAAVDPTWADVPLAGLPLVVSRVDGPVIGGAAGLRALLTPYSRSETITVRGTLDPTSPGAAALAVLPASRQRVVVVAPGLDVTVAGAKDGWLAAADTLNVTWRPHVDTAPAAQQPLANAEASTAVWAEPGALIARAAVRWRVVRGELARFELDVAGLEEVEVTGANLASAVREGDRMVLTPRVPVKGTFAVDVRARRPLTGDGEVPAPAPRPIAGRVERYWTVGRAEDGELVPVGGPRAVPARALPAWAQGLSDTPPESFWQGDAPLTVRVARFTPLMGPDTVIERAELVVAAAAEGRALVRTTWHVRNERRQYLHVRPSDGLRPMTARVSGEPVSVLSDGADGVYVPLEKSVETVEGLLTFPVELTWIAEGEVWAKKGERTLVLPSVDAPIQAAAWEVYLPRGWTTRHKRDGVPAPPPPPAAPVNLVAEEALQAAVSAYKKNDFSSSQQFLELARSSGSTSSNVGRLQSNLDVLLGQDDVSVEDVATRRVRELANAKTVDQQVEQEEAVDKARWAYQSGDIDEAEKYLEQVIALADDIGVTEQKESAEQSGKKMEAQALLKDVVEKKAKRSASAATKSASTISTEYLQNLPTGRAYEASVAEDADDRFQGGVEGGVVVGVVGGVHGGVVGGVHGGGVYSGMASEVTTGDGYVADPAPAAVATVTTTTTAAMTGVLGVLTDGKVAANGLFGGEDGEATYQIDGVNANAVYPAEAPAIFEGQSIGGPMSGEPPPPPPPPPPEGRAALEVKAAPLTLALPLDGERVVDTAALLPADAHPTLTLPYRRSGAPR